MEHPPNFLDEPAESIEEATFQPSLPSRRGELIAWVTVLGVGIGTAVLALRLGELPAIGLGMTLFLILIAGLISFGGWMERNTSIQVLEVGVRYRSPVRRVSLGWRKIERLQADRAGDGWRIRVQGDGEHFSFRTAATLRFGSFSEMALGFEHGERIAGLIRLHAELTPPKPLDGGWVCVREQGGTRS